MCYIVTGIMSKLQKHNSISMDDAFKLSTDHMSAQALIHFLRLSDLNQSDWCN